MQDLENKVTELLVSNHAFLIEEAETAVAESVSQTPDIWNDNADAKELAIFLASDEVDE